MLPGLPLIESPLFKQKVGELEFSPEEERIACSLNENGYAIFDFPDENLNEKIARIKSHLSPLYKVNFDDPEADKTIGERRVQDAWAFDEDVRSIAANQAVIELLSKLYGRTAIPFQTLNFPVGTQQAAHSDAVHFSSLPERFMCGVWLAMEDVSPASGPLFYHPGSHRWPIMTNGLIGRRGYGSELESAQDPYQSAWEALCDAGQSESEVFLPRKGQALIWCANLLHGGSMQTDTKSTRWSQVTHYYFDQCIYYTPAFSDEFLGRLRLRDVISIVDGNNVPNFYLNENLPPNRIMKNKSLISRIKNFYKKMFQNLAQE